VKPFLIPRDRPNVVVDAGCRPQRPLTNLDKVYFPDRVSRSAICSSITPTWRRCSVPYLTGRAMVLKRYPGGSPPISST
jgi:hypothetical protein